MAERTLTAPRLDLPGLMSFSCSRLFWLLFLILPGGFSAGAQTVREDLRSTDPRAFDTMEPSSYRLDFPVMPDTDPLADFSGEEPMPMSTRSDPQEVFDEIARSGLPRPTTTPGDYNPENVFLLTRFQDEEPPQASVEYPVSGPREIVLLNHGHPVFSDLSKTAALFEIVESQNSLVTPEIPDPSLIFEKQREHLRTAGPVRYALDFFQSFASVYNVFGTADGIRNDTFFTFNPRIYLETGTKGQASISYSPSFVRYQKYPELDAANENTTFAIRYPFSKLQFGSDLSYQTQSGLFVDSDGYVRQRSWISNTYLRYPWSQKTDSTLSYTGVWNQKDPGGRRTDHRVALILDHQYSLKTVYGLFVEGGRSDAPAGEQRYHTMGLRFLYRPDYHLRFLLEGGYHRREMEPALPSLQVLQTPVFRFTASYHRTANLGFVLRVYRDVSTDGFDNVALQTRTGADFSFLARFQTKTEFTLRVGTGHMEMWADQEPYDSDLSYVEAAATLSYAITRNVEAILFNNLQRRYAASDSNRYTSNTIGLAINLRF